MTTDIKTLLANAVERSAKGYTIKDEHINPTYQSHREMIRRCYDPVRAFQQHYEAKNIKVCKRWVDSFDTFMKDMGLRPNKMVSLDRIHPKLGYFPENCRWASFETQARNRDGAGVHFDKEYKKWRAAIKVDGRKVFLGRFENHEDAVKARKIAERKYYPDEYLSDDEMSKLVELSKTYEFVQSMTFKRRKSPKSKKEAAHG